MILFTRKTSNVDHDLDLTKIGLIACNKREHYDIDNYSNYESERQIKILC